MLETEHQHINEQIDDLRHRRAQAIKVHDYLATQPPLTYSDQAWNTLVDHATVTSDGTISIQFKDNIERDEKRAPSSIAGLGNQI